MVRITLYVAKALRRQWGALLIVACGLLGGCGNIHLGSGDITASTPGTAPLAYGSSDHADWDLIRSTVAASLSAPHDARIEWQNAANGDSGTISELAASGADRGRTCRSFASTIAGVDGVRLYRAEMCRSIMNTWDFARIEPADAAKAPN